MAKSVLKSIAVFVAVLDHDEHIPSGDSELRIRNNNKCDSICNLWYTAAGVGDTWIRSTGILDSVRLRLRWLVGRATGRQSGRTKILSRTG
jgi:hypothetical protein